MGNRQSSRSVHEHCDASGNVNLPDMSTTSTTSSATSAGSECNSSQSVGSGGSLSRSRSVRHHMGDDNDHCAAVTVSNHRQPLFPSNSKSPSFVMSSEPSRYLPRGLDKAHNGIIFPRVPYGEAAPIEPSSSSSSELHNNNNNSSSARVVGGDALGGVESPQWGWFLRTTPPTPQMYYPRALNAVAPPAPPLAQQHRHYANHTNTGAAAAVAAKCISASGSPSMPLPPPVNQVNHHCENHNNHNNTGTNNNESPYSSARLDVSVPALHPNPVFQGLRDKHQTAQFGWSSVPL